MKGQLQMLDKLAVNGAIRRAERHLAKADPIMKRLIVRHGHCPIAEREFQPFHMLANSIISQQLSTKAAATIKSSCRRPGRRAVSNRVKCFRLRQQKLRGAGLSGAKTRYIRDACGPCQTTAGWISTKSFLWKMKR